MWEQCVSDIPERPCRARMQLHAHASTSGSAADCHCYFRGCQRLGTYRWLCGLQCCSWWGEVARAHDARTTGQHLPFGPLCISIGTHAMGTDRSQPPFRGFLSSPPTPAPLTKPHHPGGPSTQACKGTPGAPAAEGATLAKASAATWHRQSRRRHRRLRRRRGCQPSVHASGLSTLAHQWAIPPPRRRRMR